jgi:peptide deformylase
VPSDKYGLSAEDTERFAEEAAAGMIAPQDPRLRQESAAVDPAKLASPEMQAVVTRLMRTAGSQQHRPDKSKKRRTLVGLAAPQIGEMLRIIIIDTKIGPSRKKPGKLECFINPEIVWRSRETEEGREGCFSAGPVWGLVRRSVAVKIRALTPKGKVTERIFEGFTARIAQHEIDHLNGIRFADRITDDKKRHWVHTEELPIYPELIRKWPRTVSRERWDELIGGQL